MTELRENTRYIPFLDGCRGLAILIVLFAHAGLDKFIPGGFGVTIFFFISGYLITKLLLVEIENTGVIRLQDFYLRRFFRLYPALVMMILVAGLAALLLQCPLAARDVLAALFYFTNYYIGWLRDPVADCARMLDIMWSLAIEEHFYLFFPLLTFLFLKKRSAHSGKYFLVVLLVLCAVALFARIFMYLHNPDHADAAGKIYFSTHTRMDAILWGCIAAVLIFSVKSTRYLSILNNKKYLVAGLLLLLSSLLIRETFFRETFRFTLQGIGLLLVLPALENRQDFVVKSIFQTPFIIFVGRISYSLYLFHWIVLKTTNRFQPEFSLKWQLLYWPISVALSLLSYFLVEKPFVSLRRRFGSHIRG